MFLEETPIAPSEVNFVDAPLSQGTVRDSRQG